MNTLIVYASRFGATKGTAEEIAKILREKNFDVTVIDAKQEKIKDISQFDLVIVGSGMAMGNWVGEAEDFVRRFQKDFENKKLALFISSLEPIERKMGNTKALERIQKIGFDDKIAKYHLKPITVGLFGGIVDYPKIGFLMRKGMEIGYKSQLQKYEFKEIEPDVYDLRDWDKIRNWANQVAEEAQK